MRSPSGRILDQTVDVYATAAGSDADGGPRFTPSGGATTLACSAQPGEFFETQENSRVTKQREWRLIFGVPVSISPKDQIIHVDRAGISHTLFAEADRDEAGRGGAYSIRAVEKV